MNKLQIIEDKNRKWKRFKYANIGCLNDNVMFTFEKVYQIVTEHVKNIIIQANPSFKDRDFPSEYVGTDPASVRIKDTPREMLDNRILPRIVFNHSFDPLASLRVDIPNNQDFNRVNAGLLDCILSVKQKSIENTTNKPYYYMRDVDMVLIGSPRYTMHTIYVSVLVNERIQAQELAQQFTYIFPLNKTKPLYMSQEVVTLGSQPDIRKYTLETSLPDNLLKLLTTTFGISDTGTTGDLELLKILQKHSETEVDYIVDGSKRKRAFAVKFPFIPTITPVSIDLGEREINNVMTYGVKIEFQVDYIEYPVYSLSASFSKLNTESYKNAETKEATEDKMAKIEVPVAVFSENLCDLTIVDKMKITYGKEDIVQNGNSSYGEVNILDIIPDEKVFNYIRNMRVCVDPNEYCKFFAIECQRGERNRYQGDIPTVGNEKDFIIDYDDFVINDAKAKEGNKVYVAIYINKKHFTDWCEKNGYSSQTNLSAYN